MNHMDEQEIRKAQEDGYVECSECGHPIEDHARRGCTTMDCPCTVAWTQKAIGDYRQRCGLPRRYSPLERG